MAPTARTQIATPTARRAVNTWTTTSRTPTCRIEPDALRAAEAWVTGQRTAWETRLDRLGDYLAGHGADSQNTDSQKTDSQKGR